MIDFSKYIGKYIVLMTNNFLHPEELPGIRDGQSKVFKYAGAFVLVRPLTLDDTKDEDFVQWMSSMWRHDEWSILNFIKNGRRHETKSNSKAFLRNV